MQEESGDEEDPEQEQEGAAYAKHRDELDNEQDQKSKQKDTEENSLEQAADEAADSDEESDHEVDAVHQWHPRNPYRIRMDFPDLLSENLI